ncbi:MAG: helix-turn-helix transcriptional regulator [Chloroflexi bacterium]|nr:helix-turn-helix transcriptional regulator [Chloroflexota bacterium]
MNDNSLTRQARLFRTLMHPVRLAILEALRGGEECVCHLEAHLGYRQAYISQQLAVLRKARLIADRRDGPNVFYRIARPDILTLLDAARAMVGGAEPAELRPAVPARCGCPKCAGAHTPLPVTRELVEAP